ncbi:MAG: DUF4202 domain-containing protein [Hyphomicrobiales bacterium]|nr:DUF4202 domain-containing protein [Hyphomicrobiales bacterium]
MTGTSARLRAVLAAIDAANARDPNSVQVDGQPYPAGLVYGRRMSETLAAIAPEASELLHIASRGQHIERWTSPRSAYPQNRSGYLRWRSELGRFHARRLAEIMAAHGYGEADIDQVGALVRKERLRSNPEAQMLEDVACLVFLKYDLPAFTAKVDRTKLATILAKTLAKMSDAGRSHAGRLDLPADIRDMIANLPT